MLPAQKLGHPRGLMQARAVLGAGVRFAGLGRRNSDLDVGFVSANGISDVLRARRKT